MKKNNFDKNKGYSGLAKKEKVFFFTFLSLFLLIVFLGILLITFNQKKEDTNEFSSGFEGNISTTVKEKLKNQSQLKKFENYRQLESFLESETIVDSKNNASFPANAGSADSRAKSENLATQSEDGGNDYSKTNVQVKGVGEADIVKTDGECIYAIAGNDLYLLKAYPAENAKVLSKIAFKSRPFDMYLRGDKVVVFGTETNRKSGIDFRTGGVYFKVFDVSDKENPSQVRDLQFEGSYFDSRIIDNQVYFITTSSTFGGGIPVPRIFEEGKEAYNYKKSGGNRPDIYYVGASEAYYNYVNVASVDISSQDSEIKSELYLLPGSENVYASEEDIYLTYTKHISGYDLMMEIMRETVLPEMEEDDREKISKINEVPVYILSQEEKKNKTNIFIEKFLKSLPEEKKEKLEKETKQKLDDKYQDISKELEKTVIQKISIDQGDFKLSATGEVAGNVLDQFSMDEKDGYFRIATTKNREFQIRPYFDFGSIEVVEDDREVNLNNEAYNNVYVLDKKLNTVGSLEDLAPEERIYSARFIQDRLYMVTFKQTDPLFAIDLKNPENPQVLGKLKIPGYSNYLHPYSENILIGLGKETEERGTGGFKTKGLKLSLFDVSDINNPKEIDKYVFEENSSSSLAQHNHKAFLFSKEKNLLAVPVSFRNNSSSPIIMEKEDSANRESVAAPSIDIMPPPNNYFRGAAVFDVNEEKIELKGMVDHSDEKEKREVWCGSNCYDTTVKRSLYIEDFLYTVSSKYVGINRLDDLSRIEKIELKKEKEEDHEVVN